MPRDAITFLWDAVEAAANVVELAEGRSYADFEADRQFRWAVERQLQIVGEALSQLSRIDPELAARVPDLRAIVAFRHILVHGYAQLDEAAVWTAVAQEVPALRIRLKALAQEVGG